MGFPRSDEARREDGLYDRIGVVERSNREKDEEITALKKKITTLKAENRKLKAWRREYDAGESERRWKAMGGSW